MAHRHTSGISRRLSSLGKDMRRTATAIPARFPWILASDPGAIYADAGQGYPSPARRLHFVDKVALDAGLRMMLVDRFGVRGIQHAINHVVLLAKQDVVVRDSELVRRRVLQTVQFVRRERLHGMGIDELRHGCHVLPPVGGFAVAVVIS